MAPQFTIERKSRRILAVLSKAVRREAISNSGLVLGVTTACGIYCFALGLTGSWTLGAAGFPISRVWFLMVCLVAACMLAGTVALMFSTFLNPFLAAGATALMLGVPWIASQTVARALGLCHPGVCTYHHSAEFHVQGARKHRVVSCLPRSPGNSSFLGDCSQDFFAGGYSRGRGVVVPQEIFNAQDLSPTAMRI